MDRDGLSGFELLVLVIGAAAAVVIGVVWAGAHLALKLTGERAPIGVTATGEALERLPANATDPAAAWITLAMRS